jgi:hypothetical protein
MHTILEMMPFIHATHQNFFATGCVMTMLENRLMEKWHDHATPVLHGITLFVAWLWHFCGMGHCMAHATW